MNKILFLFMVLYGANIFAQPLKTYPIPWVQSNLEIPHIAVNGLPTNLQAIAEGGSCGSYSYRWDVNGDNDFDDPNENTITVNNTNGYFAPLHLQVQYPNSLGNRFYFPKVEVTCGSEIATTVYPIQIIVDGICPDYFTSPNTPNCGMDGNLAYTRNTYSNRALDNALWYLFRQASHKNNDSLNHNEHLCYVTGNQTLYTTGHTLNVFLRRGHGFGLNRDNDPYYRHLTQCGLHSILSTMQLKNIGFTDTDTLGNFGKGMEFVATNNLSAWFWSSYESTAWVEPLANFGNPNYISPVGRDGIYGENLKNIGQDLIDGLLQCTTSDGAWFYTCSNMAGITDDASTNGWASEGIRLLKRKFNNVDYDSFKTKQRTWLNLYCPNGNCFYDGGGGKLAGNALVGYGWTENEDSTLNGQITQAVNSIQSWFLTDNNHWGLYYIYATTKGLRSFNPEITYLPNGIHWSNEYIDFFITGKNSIKNSSGTAKQLDNGSWTWAGNWLWAGSFSTNERTAVIAQIIQSWLEIQPFARATPSIISPNTEVTFNHSWSYVLDPSITIDLFKWNVIDNIDENLALCSNTNLPPCNEDLNLNGLIDDNEIVWDFVTADLNETFKYTYTTNVDWGSIKKQKVTLRAFDNLGRYVDDKDSLEIKISKYNHAPVTIPNTYTGFSGQTIILDASNSYDTDIAQTPYTNKPHDFISTISYDFDNDGVFETTTNPVQYPIPLNTSSKISIPFKVCDDGQWTNSCTDGVEKLDCSLCSYNTMLIMVLPNLEPPVFVGETHLIADGSFALIDFSNTFDPENATFEISLEIVNGLGSIENLGNNQFAYHFNGDGFRIDKLKATAIDVGGLTSHTDIYVEIPNKPPVFVDMFYTYENLPPIVSSSTIRNLGNAWFQLNISATPNPFVEIQCQAIISDADPTISVSFTHLDALAVLDDLEPYLSSVVVSEGIGVFNAIASDGVDSSSLSLPYWDIPKASNLKYDIDLNADGSFEVYGSSLNNYTFQTNALQTLPIKIFVRDDLGLITESLIQANVLNQNPMFTQTDFIQNGKQVLIVSNAIDLDNDTLTYVFEPNDNSDPLSNTTGIFNYTYTSFGVFTPSIKVTDSRYGSTTYFFEPISFYENQPPIINSITPLIGYGGFVDFIIEAQDPENETISYHIYKDNVLLATNNSNAPIELPYLAGATQSLTIKVFDQSNNSTEQTTNIALTDTPTEIGLNYYELNNDHRFLIVANVEDQDTENLNYYWNVTGTFEKGDSILIVDLDPTRDHTIILRVEDLWSSVFTESEISISAIDPPVIENVDAHITGGGEVVLITQTNAQELMVDWGDGISNMESTHIYNGLGNYTIKIRGWANGSFSNEYIKPISIVDFPPTLDNVYVNQIGNMAWVEIFVNEFDTDLLKYSFDLKADGVWEVQDTRSNRTTFVFNESGSFNLKIGVLDTWSNTYTEFSHEIEIEDWETGIDNIQVSEGDCVWFKADSVTAIKIDPVKCSTFVPVATPQNSQYVWTIQNQTFYDSELGYVFEDDGIYDVSLNRNGAISRIRVYVDNTAPEFVSVPDSVVVAGAKYKYDIKVIDKGTTDDINLILGQGSPTYMELSSGGENNTWVLEWDVPQNLGGGEVSIVLIAEDIHRTEGYITRDGGKTEQRFRIRILEKNTMLENEMFVDKNLLPQPQDLYLIDQMNEPIMVEDKSFGSKFKGNPTGCNSSANVIISYLIILIYILILRWFSDHNDHE